LAASISLLLIATLAFCATSLAQTVPAGYRLYHFDDHLFEPNIVGLGLQHYALYDGEVNKAELHGSIAVGPKLRYQLNYGKHSQVESPVTGGMVGYELINSLGRHYVDIGIQGGNEILPTRIRLSTAGAYLGFDYMTLLIDSSDPRLESKYLAVSGVSETKSTAYMEKSFGPYAYFTGSLITRNSHFQSNLNKASGLESSIRQVFGHYKWIPRLGFWSYFLNWRAKDDQLANQMGSDEMLLGPFLNLAYGAHERNGLRAFLNYGHGKSLRSSVDPSLDFIELYAELCGDNYSFKVAGYHYARFFEDVEANGTTIYETSARIRF